MIEKTIETRGDVSPSPHHRIRPACPADTALLVKLIRESHRDVAVQFGLSGTNCPKHPSFCTEDWIAADFARGEKYFILANNEEPVGCVAYEKPSATLAYLNRLSVLPPHRRKGYGAELVRFILELARRDSVGTLSIGVIGEHTALLKWYGKLGFVYRETKRFPHLPFSVTYMSHAVDSTEGV